MKESKLKLSPPVILATAAAISGLSVDELVDAALSGKSPAQALAEQRHPEGHRVCRCTGVPHWCSDSCPGGHHG